MEAPKLLKNESFASFRKRAAMWEKRTGKKYPRSKRISMRGSTEDMILDGGIQMSGLTSKIDYSKDYNLDDQAKDEVLAGSYAKYKESEEGKKFARQQLAIQEAIDQDKKEDFALKASKGLNIDTSQMDNAVDTLDKLKNKETLTIPKEVKKEGNETESSTVKPSGSSSGSTVHTRHYKTGERLGVMGRSQRRAYDKEAAGRTFESEVAKYEKSSGHGKSHLRETLYKRNLRKNKKKLSIDD